MPRRSSAAVASLAVLALTLSACVIRLGGPDSGISFHSWGSDSTNTVVQGRDISVEDGTISVDGHELHHARWVDVPLPADSCERLELVTATGPIDVDGQLGDGTLRVRLWTEVEGDGEVALEDGRLVAHGRHGEAFVNEITGSVPHCLSLQVTSSTGAIALQSLRGAGRIEVESGIGEVQLVDCMATSIGVEGGTAAVLLKGGEAGTVDLRSGTGELELTAGHFGQVQAETGTGDVTLRDCIVQRLQATSGTGDVVMHGGRVEELHHELGTGEIYLRGGVTVGLAD